MSGLKSLFFGALVASVVAVNPACSNQGIYSLIAAEISGLPEAQSYCSKNYPIPTKTTTSTAATSTISTTVATNTVTSTTATITTTVTTTTTTTTTVTQNAKRTLLEARSAPPLSTSSVSTTQAVSTVASSTIVSTITPATTIKSALTTLSTSSTVKSTRSVPNAWASILSAQAAIIGQICTCAENPQTSTVYTTPLTTTSLTATSTSNVATTTTVTTTITATATVIVQGCTNGNYCTGGKQYNIECGTVDTDGGNDIYTPASNYKQCAGICAADSKCQSFNFDPYGSGTCNGYYHINRAPLGAVGGNPGYVYGTLTGTC